MKNKTTKQVYNMIVNRMKKFVAGEIKFFGEADDQGMATTVIRGRDNANALYKAVKSIPGVTFEEKRDKKPDAMGYKGVLLKYYDPQRGQAVALGITTNDNKEFTATALWCPEYRKAKAKA